MLEKEDRPKMNNLKKSKVNQSKHKRNRTEISEVENKKSVPKISETKSWFFENIIKINRPP